MSAFLVFVSLGSKLVFTLHALIGCDFPEKPDDAGVPFHSKGCKSYFNKTENSIK